MDFLLALMFDGVCLLTWADTHEHNMNKSCCLVIVIEFNTKYDNGEAEVPFLLTILFHYVYRMLGLLVSKQNHHYLLVLLSGFVILARGFLVILKTGFIIFLIGLEELNPVIPAEFVPVVLAMDSAVAFF